MGGGGLVSLYSVMGVLVKGRGGKRWVVVG